ncbi:amidase [Streptomyces sp. NRRL B-1677]|uniref:Amidase n=1 Tax=Streptomyces klenkii TaxID=1420899 RepID=A0A3B0AWS8_9ACTN|nr:MULTISPECIES: amidase [Streptomyces]MBF6048844.1 amidase [Streptomyces sp. NRRL B-1677]RKN64990.1 amidase [Streptomyces klenkii]
MPSARQATALHELSVPEAGALLRSGELTSVELTRHALDRIARFDPALHAFILVTEETALERAAAADRDLRAGTDRGPMHGIPYALKDIFDAEGVPTTNASWLRTDDVARADSTVESRLRAGGAVGLGKLTTFEFAVGGPSFDLPVPPARNPWSEEHVPSGSSSGSGAAVAAGLTRVTIGSDTSGSTRGPAFHCAAVGLKPTYGRVSGHGVQTLSRTLDHFGPLTWTVADAAAALHVVAGADPADPRTAGAPAPDWMSALGRGVAGLRVATSPGWYADDPLTMPEITAGIERALGVLGGHGASVEEVTLPPYDVFNACGRVVFAAEAFAVHQDDLRRRPRSFGRYTYQRVMPGAGIAAADYLRALDVRQWLKRRLDETVFERHDVLVTVCGQTTAARWSDFPENWPPPKLANDMQTIPFSVTGHPALSLPIGFAADGLPIGLQIVGRAHDEATVFRVAEVLEAELGERHRRPQGMDTGIGLGRTGAPAGRTGGNS